MTDSCDLTQKKCVPCQGGIPPLAADDAKTLLRQATGWQLDQQCRRIQRRFEFKDFKVAMAFVNRMAELAESEGHHPDFAVHYSKVNVELWTHKIDGLHENDFIMAAKINELGHD